MMILSLSICSLIVFQLLDMTSSTYTFRDAESWPMEFPQCGAENQSPIDIDIDDAQPGQFDQPFTVYNMNKPPNKFTLNNTGKGLRQTGEWDDDDMPMITGGPLGLDQYVFGCIEYYWSSEIEPSTPHTINGESFVLEMHMKYFKKNYGSAEMAKKYEDGIATVVGIWTEWGHGNSNAINFVVSKLPEVEQPGSVTDVQPYSFVELLDDPSDPPDQYITYEGSDIKPPCYPMIYFLQNYLYAIKPQEINLFQNVQFDGDDTSNVRPTQPLGDRVIYLVESKM